MYNSKEERKKREPDHCYGIALTERMSLIKMITASYFTYVFVFRCQKCAGPAPCIKTFLSPQPQIMSEPIETVCSCGFRNLQPGGKAVHALGLEFRNGECYVLHNHTELIQDTRSEHP